MSIKQGVLGGVSSIYETAKEGWNNLIYQGGGIKDPKFFSFNILLIFLAPWLARLGAGRHATILGYMGKRRILQHGGEMLASESIVFFGLGIRSAAWGGSFFSIFNRLQDTPSLNGQVFGWDGWPRMRLDV